MANVQYYDVILKPVVTEKSMNAMTDKKYTFLVHTEANKTMIKEAVEKMFPGTKVKRRTFAKETMVFVVAEVGTDGWFHSFCQILLIFSGKRGLVVF